jgi:hypothetical protein
VLQRPRLDGGTRPRVENRKRDFLVEGLFLLPYQLDRLRGLGRIEV